MLEHDPLDLRLNVEIIGHTRQLIDNCLQRSFADRGRNGGTGILGLENCGRFLELRLPARLLLLDRFYIVEHHLEPKTELGFK